MSEPEAQPPQVRSSFRFSVLFGACFASLPGLLLVHFVIVNPLFGGLGPDTIANPAIAFLYLLAAALGAFSALFLSSLFGNRRGIVRVGWLALISLGLVLGTVFVLWLIFAIVFSLSMSGNSGHGL